MPVYSFYDGQRLPVVEVRVPEHAVQDIEYHNYTWPCAVELSRYLVEERQILCGKRFLEIGAGTSLPSAVAALLGSSVVIADHSSAVHVCRRTLESNGLTGGDSATAVCFNWADEQSFSDLVNNPLWKDGFDVILCSDCYYDDAVNDDVTVTLSMLLRQWPEALVLCSYQVRDGEWLRDIDAGLSAFQLRRIPIGAAETVKCLVRETNTNSSTVTRQRKHLSSAEIILWRIERVLP